MLARMKARKQQGVEVRDWTSVQHGLHWRVGSQASLLHSATTHTSSTIMPEAGLLVSIILDHSCRLDCIVQVVGHETKLRNISAKVT